METRPFEELSLIKGNFACDCNRKAVCPTSENSVVFELLGLILKWNKWWLRPLSFFLGRDTFESFVVIPGTNKPARF